MEDSERLPPSVGQRLARMAAEQPDKTLYTHLLFDDKPPVRISRRQAWRGACDLAGRLAVRNLRQRPILLLYEAGPEFGLAFLGVLLAGAIAVPVPVPQFAAQFDHLGRIVDDCAPGLILSTGDLQAKIVAKLSADSPLRRLEWQATDAPAGSPDPLPSLQPVAPTDIALLQYTSGSTSEPKGVTLTHANIAHNLDMLAEAFEPVTGARIVSWLPHFHDMGLVTGLLGPMTCDGESILMSPRSFLFRPMRWLQAISDYRAEISGAPNFAYELCTRWADRGERAALDLSCWRSAFAGAEPVRMATLDAFAERFRGDGFARSALTPCYGMAEATLLVTCKRAGAAPATYRLAREAAGLGHADLSDDPASLTLTGCGYPTAATRLRIVDPESHVALPTGRIGEAWITGPQIARGYWNRQGDHAPFGTLSDEGDGLRWLRTGDLGFVTQTGEFVFVDRLKDLIIVNGHNYACHDLELTAASSHALLSAGACVAVGIEVGGQTQIAIIAELPPFALAEADDIVTAIRGSLFTTHCLAVRTIAFVSPRKLSRTTSGKLQRRLTALRLFDGTLQLLAQYGDQLTVSKSPLQDPPPMSDQ